MKETIKIEFDEAQKAVTAHVKVEFETEDPRFMTEAYRDEILKESQRLFNLATDYSKALTLKKNM